MKKAFYPGMAPLGRMRPKDAARTVSSRALEQQTFAGLISFNEAGTGHSTIFATEEPPEPTQEPGGQESILRGSTPVPQESVAQQPKNHYPNVNYFSADGKGL